MICRLIFAFAAVTAACAATAPSRAEEPAATGIAPPAPQEAAPAQPEAGPPQPEAAPPSANAPAGPDAEALCKAIATLAAEDTDEERNEVSDLISFYKTRACAPLWLTPDGRLTPKASPVFAEVGRADEWGLNPRDFPLPSGLEQANTPSGSSAAAALPGTPETTATAEIKISLAILKYGRYARGGRIINPSEQLSSYLDRRPQLLKPGAILEGIASAGAPDAYLRGLNPAHPQFEMLRQKYLELLRHKKQKSAEARKLLANMEEWRWMPADLGELYIWNNLPDFTQRVVKNGQIVREVHIVAGETGKQTPVFTRPLRKITFKPTWIVPDSIKVRELWPDMLRGGSLMREWGLEVRTKDGQPLNWRKIRWSSADIREYEVIQPNGPKSVLGKVKFSFPSQHTVFMHDTLEKDKWMFKVSRRTYSHGCMRVADPIGLAKIVLSEDKGWDATRVAATFNLGPLNNEIAVDRKIPVHITYFTVLAGADGKLHSFPDVYGHERRITQGLEGKWDQIVKGRDHLAPVELDMADAVHRPSEYDYASEMPEWQRRARHSGGGGFFSSIFGDDGL